MRRPNRSTLALIVVCSAWLVGCTEPAAQNGAGSATRPAFLDELVTMTAPSAPLRPGEQLPEFIAEGWMNGGPVSRTELLGKVVVIETWAHW